MKKRIIALIIIVSIINMILPNKSVSEEQWLWPVPSENSSISQYYSSSHDALDIRGGGDILATKSGKVVYTYTGCNNRNAASTGISCTLSSCNPSAGERSFWANENKPLEPVHVHVSKGKPSPNATKFWITKSGKCLLANNNQK